MFVLVAKILTAHGIKGEVKIKSFTESAAKLLEYKELFIGSDVESLKKVRLKHGKVSNQVIIASLEGIEDRNAALEFTHLNIYVSRDSFAPLKNDEVYWVDLIGCTVYNQDERCYGIVADILATPAHDVLVVKPSNKSLDNQERMIPFIKQYIPMFDISNKVIVTSWEVDF